MCYVLGYLNEDPLCAMCYVLGYLNEDRLRELLTSMGDRFTEDEVLTNYLLSSSSLLTFVVFFLFLLSVNRVSLYKAGRIEPRPRDSPTRPMSRGSP